MSTSFMRIWFAVYPRGHGRGTIIMKKSTDGGTTWSDRPPPVRARAAPLPRRGADSPPPEGKQQANELPWMLAGDRYTARYTHDGRVIVTFRDMAAESPTRGEWVAWVGRYADIVAGTPGICRVRLMDNQDGTDCANPGLELLPDGTFVAVTYGHWTRGEEPYLVSVRFRIEEIDSLLMAARS